jgi:(p)ppGpp synthase/HD superfamily hydrolase
MSLEDTLEKVRQFADEAHDGQMRKYSPERYIVHPVRVMEICRDYDNRLPVLAAALLHDVLEDTEVNEKALDSFLKSVMSYGAARETLQLVNALTDVYVKSAYPQWNRDTRKAKERERIAHTSATSQTIKYADIIDNCREIVAHDPGFAPRFLKECRSILQVAQKGNSRLYHLAIAAVNAELVSLQRKTQH